MPFPFSLPSPSVALLSDCFDSITHPALPLIATTHRNIVRDALKRHRRLPAAERSAHLSTISDAIYAYIPYLSALNAGTAYSTTDAERVDVQPRAQLKIRWRSSLAATLPGRDPPRFTLTRLPEEIAIVLSTLAAVQVLLARRQMRRLSGTQGDNPLTDDQRIAALSGAQRALSDAYGIYMHVQTLPVATAPSLTIMPVDLQPSSFAALAALAIAEATLVAVGKVDPYAAAVAESRNARNTDWMFKAPSLNPKPAHRLAANCLAAAEHAARAHGLLNSLGASSTVANPLRSASRVTEDLIKYTLKLRRTARAKAARFLAVNADATQLTGEALAWLQGARHELGLGTALPADESERPRGLRALKHKWQEHREDKRATDTGMHDGSRDGSSNGWGMDAGGFEETRIIDMLAAKWQRENNTIYFQAIPAFAPLLADRLPSSREPFQPMPSWTPPQLTAEDWARLRAPPHPEDQVFLGDELDSDEDVEGANGVRAGEDGIIPSGRTVVGAFPDERVESNNHSSGYY